MSIAASLGEEASVMINVGTSIADIATVGETMITESKCDFGKDVM
jgi:hypothetical protein